jgi:hypothetical protein
MEEGTRLTAHGHIVGTPAYIAPELIDGRPLTPAADVFSWGGVIAFAGTGRAPFDGRSLHEVLNKVGSHPPDLDGLDPILREVVERTLSKRPEQRPTVPELLNGFAASLDGTPGTGGEGGAAGGTTKVAPPQTKIMPSVPPAGPPAPPAYVPPMPPGTPPPMPRGTPPPFPPGTRPPLPPGTRPPIVHAGGGTPPPYHLRRRPSPFSLLLTILAGIAAIALVLVGIAFMPDMWKDIGESVEARQSARATSSPKGSVDKRFIGRWSGTVTEYKSNGEPRTKYTVVLNIRAGRAGSTVGSSRYAKLKCSGELKLEAATATRLNLRERIVTGRANCMDSVPMTLTHRKDGALDYVVPVDSTPSRGRLTRQK